MATRASGTKRTARPKAARRASASPKTSTRSLVAPATVEAPPTGGGLTGSIGGLLHTTESVISQISGRGRSVGQLASMDATSTIVNVAALVERCNKLLDRFEEEGGVDRLFGLLDQLEPMVDRGGPLIERAGPLLDRADPLLEELEQVPTSVFQIRDWVEDVHHHLVPVLHGLGLDLVRLERLPLAGRIRKRMEKQDSKREAATAKAAAETGASRTKS